MKAYDAQDIVQRQKDFFRSGATRPLSFRLEALGKLKAAIKECEGAIESALMADFNKSPFETYMCETGMIYSEIAYLEKHLASWVKNKTVPTPLAQFRSKSFISPEPLGAVYIMSPWNYPLQLCLLPLAGAIAAGNCAVVKPSSHAHETSAVINRILSMCFPPEYVCAVEGSRTDTEFLLHEPFNHIFFTGNAEGGRSVLRAAAENLVPVTLELGGKSPVIVDETADITVAARRIAFGKILNAGQTCVEPDYLLIKKDIKTDFILEFKRAVEEFFPTGDFSDMPVIISDRHYKRVKSLLDGQNIVLGGKTDDLRRFIEPSLVDEPSLNSKLMTEEIFGPILPMIGYSSLDSAIELILDRPKPLALYLFTRSEETEQKILSSCSFGGGCINDTIIHLASEALPFGGVGASGMGRYHGKASFDTFTHYRSIVKKAFSPDLDMRYHPYTEKKLSLIKKFMK